MHTHDSYFHAIYVAFDRRAQISHTSETVQFFLKYSVVPQPGQEPGHITPGGLADETQTAAGHEEPG